MLAQKNNAPSASPMLAVVYALLIVYGSLYPFSGWLPTEGMLAFLTAPWPRYIIRSDLIINFLAYLPLGLLAARAVRYRLRPVAAVIAATALCLLLSLAMESLQALLPERVSSLFDLLLNGLGGLGGALLAGLVASLPGPLRWLAALRHEWFLPGRAMDLGLAAIGLWALSQLSPLLLSLDTDTLRRALLPLWTPGFPTLFNWPQLAANTCIIAGLGLFGAMLARPEKNNSWPFAGLFIAVLLVKILVVGRYLMLETVIGAAMGIALMFALHSANRPLRSIVSGLALLAGFALIELEPATGVIFRPPQPFNWIPFHGQMHNLAGFSGILSLFWPFLALGCLAAFATKPAKRRPMAWLGGVLVLAFLFALEWQQQTIPGRNADITDILLALAGWTLPWWSRIHSARGEHEWTA
ncbi:MAG: VanZ family protein [Sulfuricella sp.]|nr:VanZ family protein [Sulfuricella sp.]